MGSELPIASIHGTIVYSPTFTWLLCRVESLRTFSCASDKTHAFKYFSPTAECQSGSLHNICFGVFWASWGGSGKEPGSGNRRWFHVSICFDGFWQVLGFRMFRGFDGFSQVPRSEGGSRFRRFWSSGFWWFLMGSDSFEGFGFRWGSEGSGTLKVHLWRKTRHKKKSNRWLESHPFKSYLGRKGNNPT